MMTSRFAAPLHDDTRGTGARSETYKILSAVFVFPGDARRSRFVLADAPRALRRVAPHLPYTFAPPGDVRNAPAGDDATPARVFTRLFDNCRGRAAVSLYERDHSSDDPRRIWEDLIRFYEHFGIRYHLASNREWPDWIGMELEFLHLLSFLEARAGAATRETYVAAQADFLERHLGLWIPRFADALAKEAAGTPYAMYADALGRFIAADLRFLRERRPAPPPARERDETTVWMPGTETVACPSSGCPARGIGGER
jgi:DMSO reductase family type II enzyme chaperone